MKLRAFVLLALACVAVILHPEQRARAAGAPRPQPPSFESPPAPPPGEPSAEHWNMRPIRGHGVFLFSGEFHCAVVDLRIKGRGLDFCWARKYRSRIGPDTVMGNGWDFSYNIRVE